LKDFRKYRPGNHRDFLEYVHDKSIDLNLKSYALKEKSSAALYLHILNQGENFSESVETHSANNRNQYVTSAGVTGVLPGSTFSRKPAIQPQLEEVQS